jgi:cytochrome c-type biogenesis protein CcmH/NrfG
LKKIRALIEKYPKVWNGWFLLGWTLRKLKRYGDALESLKKAEELGGTNSDVKNETAICLMELGDLKAARKELEQALYEEPENIKIISNLGVLALKAGKREEADAFFRTVLELEPEDALARRYLEE